MNPRKTSLCALVALAFAVPARAADEPPILAYHALVTDNAGASRRWETYPLVAAYRDRYIDLAEAADPEALLKSHPGFKTATFAPKGQVCSEIPVMLGKPEPVPEAELSDPSPSERPRQLTLVVFSTGAAPTMIATMPEGIPRALPPEGPERPSADPLEPVRKSIADRLGGTPNEVLMEKHGEHDFDGDGLVEMVLVGNVDTGQAGGPRALLTVVRQGLLALPVYTHELPPQAKVIGMGDLNGDGKPEIAVQTAQGPRDFGFEIHGWSAQGRTLRRVFERRSYGCY